MLLLLNLAYINVDARTLLELANCLLGTLNTVNKIVQMLAILVNWFSTFLNAPVPFFSPLSLFLCKGYLNIV